ncbi:NAD(P)/FAD-dependent oxidoreductase [Facklamia miroungae]|uniref:Ferredoxin--NADP reductase n=1 Tax=Facklamia miroungae TaxID=120956 RepID=A0A1G7U6H8_9LACT|nr:NAD(P)/FAD-dependent oxidoreductase [Facklamia miroungae]NKZ29931.1 NAD(P)/FAD-dependent oxidoreductase [Facklamia miroungae]SDG43063.1 thioredoxin reductase (NADPH) [Facklamia miroungae]
MKEIYDIIIVGAGPVGLYTGFFAQMRNAKVKIIESLDEVGGQPNHLYGEKKIFDIPAYPAIKGNELSHKLHEQLNLFQTDIALGEEVLNLSYSAQNSYTIQTNKNIYRSKTVIIAAGNGAFQPRKLEVDQSDMYENYSLHYIVKNPDYFIQKKVAVCGGGDSAVDWALALEPLAKEVYLIHRRESFRALESNVSKLLASTVKVYTPHKIIDLEGSDHQIKAVKIQQVKTKQMEEIAIDQLIINYGFSNSIGQIKNWGLKQSRNQIEVNSLMETNLPGVFAVGDIADYPGKVRIIAAGFGEALIAVNQALRYINPNYRPSPLHSSSIFEGEFND